ncbi:hypothetical protein LCGC14_2051320 [marine sediment metagenome]|uniref:Uncharacterized protein n=1 Tax=marine sediment metagenome TaxID=412755 RepID=A0A0F9H2H2_9ZZZZ
MTEKKVSVLRTPSVTPAQLAVFIALVIYNILSNSYLFEGLDSVINMCITFGSYFLIMSLKGKLGDKGLLKLFTTLVEIITSKESTDIKTKRLESVLVLTARELGTLYEEDLQKLTDHLRLES